MHLAAEDLCEFYARPLGAVVRRLLTHRMRARWRRVEGQTVMGLGFPIPYLGAFRTEARRLGALMPAEQGAVVWPPGEPCATVLVDENRLPLADNSVDRLAVIHGLEFADHISLYLRELWRVLAPEGQILLVVPNRVGLWARTDVSPFGHGRPYTKSQLERLLIDAMFTPLDFSWALHVPPIERRLVLRSAIAFERMGQRFWPSSGGLLLVEAKKELMKPVGGLKVARAIGRLVTVHGSARLSA